MNLWDEKTEPSYVTNEESKRIFGSASCLHSWVEYIGLFEKFRFCRYCDKKEEPKK